MTKTIFGKVGWAPVALALCVAAATAVGLTFLALAAAQPAEAAYPGNNGKIAFFSNRSGSNIFTISPNGGVVTKITSSNGASDPAYSPNGTRIAFKSASRSNYEISVMKADGSGVRQLTDTPVVESEPTWSPDGRKIAFVASAFEVDGSQDPEIWVMNADGSGRRLLTRNSFPDTQPSWSPRGNRIAFVSGRTGDTNSNIYVMDADPTTREAAVSITPNTTDPDYQGHDDNPDWSPDGTKIAYVHNHEPNGGGVPNIWVMNPNGSNKTNISNNSTTATMPAWSPNGAKIAYVGVRPGTTNRNIYTMSASGGNQGPINTNAAHDISPNWQQLP
jgi:TolB protein